jgi:O-antigen/teichoic acid export membrane protein
MHSRARSCRDGRRAEEHPLEPRAEQETSTVRRFAANVTWMLVAQVAGKAASFVFVVIVARSLGVAEFGVFNFAISFVPLFLVFGGFGLESTVIREVARDRERLSELFSTGIALRASLGLAGLALALVAGPLFLDGAEEIAVLVIIGTALFLDELSGFLGTVFKAFETMRYHALVVLTNRVLSTALALVAVAFGAGLLVVCVTYLAGSLGAFLFGCVALRRNFPPIDLRQVRGSVARSLARTGIPLGLAGILNTAVFRIDTVMLQAIKGSVEVGLYGVAYRFFESLLFVAWSLGNVALPRMSRQNDAGRVRTFELTAALSLAFYLPIAVAMPFAATVVVETLFSPRYGEAAAATGILTGAAVLYSLAYLARMGAIALGRMREIAWIAAATLAVNLAANIFAIPRYGFEGAAWTMLATEAFEAVVLTGLFLRASRARVRVGPALAPLVASGALGVGLLVLDLEGWSALVAAAVAYPVTLLACARLFAAEELRILSTALRAQAALG